MAAATIAYESELQRFGHLGVKLYKITAPADTNTVEVKGLSSIVNVQHSNAAVAAAADAYGVDTSGNTVTFQLTGTAVDQWVIVYGLI